MFREALADQDGLTKTGAQGPQWKGLMNSQHSGLSHWHVAHAQFGKKLGLRYKHRRYAPFTPVGTGDVGGF